MKKILLPALLIAISCRLAAQTFTLQSSDLGGQFTKDFMAGNFGCNGANQSPELHWSNAPVGTQSFAITMYDMDAPTGSGFWHWVLTDIPATVLKLQRGAGNISAKLAPSACVQGMNDTGARGYQGPCPGEGEPAHRYILTVYALGITKLDAGPGPTPALTGFMLNKAALAKASIMVYCGRK